MTPPGAFHAMRSTVVCLAAFVLAAMTTTGCRVRLADQDLRRDEVLATYFTDEAAEVLGAIPLRSVAGNNTKYRGIAIGDDPLTRLWGVMLGLGDERQVVVSEHHLDDDGLIVHEYLHQADYSGLIGRRVFLEQFTTLKSDPAHAEYAARREASIIASYGESLFGRAELLLFDGLNTELVAFVGKDIATGKLLPPPYLWEPFAQTLRVPLAPAAPLELATATEDPAASLAAFSD